MIAMRVQDQSNEEWLKDFCGENNSTSGVQSRKILIDSNALVCECVSYRTGEIRTNGGRKSVLILEFQLPNQVLPLIKFFSCDKSKANNYTVGRDSDFAKLSRLTLGISDNKLFSRSNKLMSRFCGHAFVVQNLSTETRNNGDQYLKVGKIEPKQKMLFGQMD
jgi:hypothetical protein